MSENARTKIQNPNSTKNRALFLFLLFWVVVFFLEKLTNDLDICGYDAAKLSKTTGQKMLSTTESTRENIRAINEYYTVPAAQIHTRTHAFVHVATLL